MAKAAAHGAIYGTTLARAIKGTTSSREEASSPSMGATASSAPLVEAEVSTGRRPRVALVTRWTALRICAPNIPGGLTFAVCAAVGPTAERYPHCPVSFRGANKGA